MWGCADVAVVPALHGASWGSAGSAFGAATSGDLSPGVRGVPACHTGVTRGTGLGIVLGARMTPRRLAICRLTCVASARLIGSVALELARARTDCLHPLGQDVSKDEARGRDTSELEGHGHVALLHPCRMLIVITTHPPGLGTLDGCRQTPR